MILGNAGELNQVWTNLIDNAIDAIEIESDAETAEGGELHIVARQDESRVEVHVIDNGPGIPDDVRPRIFDPFFTTKAIGDGSGLGLDIARRIVRTHHGHIDVQSSPGGTAIRVLLPVSSGSG